MTFNGKICIKVEALGKYLTYSLRAEVAKSREGIERFACPEVLVKAGNGKAKCIVKHTRTENAPQNSTAHALFGHNGNRDHSKNSDQQGHYTAPRSVTQEVKGVHRNTRGAAGNNKLGILQTDKRDE